MLLYHEIKKLVKNRIIISVVSVLIIACAVLAFRTSLNVTPEENASADARNASFSSAMNRFIRDSERVLDNVSDYADRYTIEYYNACVKAYENARDNVTLTDDDTEGWGALIGFDTLFYAYLIAAVIIGAVVFYEDRRTGGRLVINATEKGGSESLLAGMLAALITTFVSFLVLTAVTVCSFALFTSLHGGGLPLQTASAYRFSPYLYTLVGTFLRLTARRALSVLTTALISILCSALINGYVPVIISSFAIPAAEFALFSVKHYAVDVFSKNVNIFAYGTSYLFGKYYTVRLFGCAIPQIVTPVILAVIIAAVLLLIIPVYNGRRRTVQSGVLFLKKYLSRIQSVSFQIKARKRSVFFWELRKAVLRPSVLFALSICIVLGIISICKTAPRNIGGNNTIYREMCETASEMTLDEAKVWLEKLKANEPQYIPSEENKEEYSEYLHSEIMRMYASALERRLNNLNTVKNLGNVRIIYDEGYEALFHTDMNVYYVIAVLIVCAGIFSRENEANTLSIMRTYKNGRRRTFYTKLSISALFSMLMFFVFAITEFIAFSGSGITLHHDVIVASVIQDCAAKTMTIGSYMILRYVIGFIACVLFAMFTAALSAVTGKTPVALIGAGAFCLIPYAVKKTGDVPIFADISSFMSANEVLQSLGTSSLIALLPLIVVTFLTIIAARILALKIRK
ncbi:MAG: hypothetical protein J5816_00125 [Clostridia bacterium]|nr:hypothetical protein [Clostridia bacterium]